MENTTKQVFICHKDNRFKMDSPSKFICYATCINKKDYLSPDK